jgi:glycosyltransferase involved in cell wall biosynthesis
MRIGIDATALPLLQFGAANYIVNLIRALLQVDTANEYVIFVKPLHAALFDSAGRAQIEGVHLPSRLHRVAWEQLALPQLATRQRLDVLHCPHYTMPFRSTCPTVVTFHDMTFFLFPELHKADKVFFFRSMISLSATRAGAIIADSESTRQDILRIIKIHSARVSAVPLGVAPHFQPANDRDAIARIRAKYHLPEKIILNTGVLEPRKNLPMLVRAFRALVDRGLPHTLVLIGDKGWKYGELFRAIETLALTARVILTGYVPEDDLALIYNAADLFVYPSLYEGFGLPILEAMACGVPVITSNIASMPEIAGDAGIFVTPTDADALANAMARALTDPDLRAQKRQDGLERARQFPWTRTARETLAVYERAAKK